MNISVVVSLYNKRSTVERAIRSISNQSLKPVEILVVNDGSSDGSEIVVEAMGIDNLRLVSQKNTGVSAARNTGVREAKCDWVAFLDADDEWLPDFLKTIDDMHEQFPRYNLYATSYFSGDHLGNKKEIQLNKIPFTGECGILHNYFEVSACSMPPICSSALCIRKEALLAIGGFPEGIRAGEDLMTWARLAARTPPVYSIVPLSIFWKEKAHTYEDRPKRVPDEGDPVGKVLQELKHDNALHTPYIDQYIALWHKMRASVYLRLGRRIDAMGEVFTSLRYQPLNWRLLVYLVFCGMPESLVREVFRRYGQ